MKNETEYILNRTRRYEVDYLYKYRDVNSRGLEKTITHGEVFLPNPTLFNDPFDCKPKISIHTSSYKRKSYYKSLIKNKRPNATPSEVNKEIKNNHWIKKINNPKHLEQLFIKFIESYGIYCLTEVPDDILMWSHYADSHKGICLQFNAAKELSLFWEAYMVTYQDQYPSVNVMDLGDYKQFFNLFATKSKHWEYEKERRVILGEEDGGSKVYTFDTALLTGIILGSKISSQDEETILKWVKAKKTHTNIYRAKISGTVYKLNIEGINC